MNSTLLDVVTPADIDSAVLNISERISDPLYICSASYSTSQRAMIIHQLTKLKSYMDSEMLMIRETRVTGPNPFNSIISCMESFDMVLFNIEDIHQEIQKVLDTIKSLKRVIESDSDEEDNEEDDIYQISD